MTYHLTKREKQDILNAFYLEENQENLKLFINILHPTNKVMGIKQ